MNICLIGFSALALIAATVSDGLGLCDAHGCVRTQGTRSATNCKRPESRTPEESPFHKPGSGLNQLAVCDGARTKVALMGLPASVPLPCFVSSAGAVFRGRPGLIEGNPGNSPVTRRDCPCPIYLAFLALRR